MNNTTFTYKGYVTVSYKQKNRRLKTIELQNTGCSRLFLHLINGLLGKTSEIWVPKYLMLYYYKSGVISDVPSSLGTPLLASCILWDNVPTPEESEDGYKISLTFLIPKQQFANLSEIDGTGTYYAALFDGETRNSYLSDEAGGVSAYVEIKNFINPNDLIDGVSVVVKWTMEIRNAN